MSSTVACIGFTDPSALAAIVQSEGHPYHEHSSTSEWIDPSGAMLLLDRAATHARPGYNTSVRTPYQSVVALPDGLAQVSVTSTSGIPLEPFTVIPNGRYTVGWAPMGRVSLVAMGVDVEFFATVEDFYDSPRSALPGVEGEPPPEVRQFGLPWPPPMEIETFIPAGKEGEALATLSGTVQFAEIHRNVRSHHEYLVSRISTICGEIDLCTPLPLEGAPEAGSIVVGQVEVLAGFPPFGVEDVNTYAPASEKINPASRELNDTPIALKPVEADEDLGGGLFLGTDGVVRAEEEHTAWKARQPKTAQPQDVSEIQQSTSAQNAPAGSGEPDSADESPASAAPAAEDDAPRPGETRREWRARTGR